MIISVLNSYLELALPLNQVCQDAIWTNHFTTIAGPYLQSGTNIQQLLKPYDVFIDGYGKVYIADALYNRIIQFPYGKIFLH